MYDNGGWIGVKCQLGLRVVTFLFLTGDNVFNSAVTRLIHSSKLLLSAAKNYLAVPTNSYAL